MRLVSNSNKKRRKENSVIINGNVVDAKNGIEYPTSSEKDTKKKEKKPVSKGKIAIRTTIIIISIILVGVIALVISLGYYVDSLDTVFPNIWAEGINLSGLSLDEATQKLIDEGYESSADDIAVTLLFPDDSSFSVTGIEVGLQLNAEEAAVQAFDYGREGTFWENAQTYISLLFERVELWDLSTPNFDDSIIHELAETYTTNFNATLFDSNLDVDDDAITILKGTLFEMADEKDVFNLVIHTFNNAIEKNEHLSVNYIPEHKEADNFNLQYLHDFIHIDAVSSYYDSEIMSGTLSSEGRTFDLVAAEEMIRSAVPGDVLHIPIYTLYPEFTKEEIDAMIFRDVLSERTTTMAWVSNRINNITLAAGFINGTVLQPGEVFSYNTTVGRRTEERGFKEAGAFVHGRLVDEIGGGICQVSSTMYAAILFTQLEVVERRPHGMTISYLPLGLDATIAWGNIDFKFKNNTDFPVRIEVSVSSNRVTVKYIGTNFDGSTFIIEDYREDEYQDNLIETKPFQIIEREDDTLPIGTRVVFDSGSTGYTVETWRRHYSADGELISRDRISRDTYRVQDRIILIGTMVPEAPPPSDDDSSYPDNTGTGDGDTSGDG
ncbi:MAG: VanW family protein [Oscillospiraceae bacterium]|nr:VanW family protein [Oscillospiraceae bacterium]